MPPRPVHRRSALTVAAAAGAALMVALGTTGCGPTGPTARPSPTAYTDLGVVRVTSGATGAAPSLAVPVPFLSDHTAVQVLQKGTGPALAGGQLVSIDYIGVNGTDGKVFDSTYQRGGRTGWFTLDPKSGLLPGMYKALLGATVGSRLLVSIPPADGYGVDGDDTGKVGPTDTLVVVIDVRSARSMPTSASGSPVPVKDGLPTVTFSGGRPRITLPPGTPPTALVSQPLIAGRGPKLSKGQSVWLRSAAVVWPGGRQCYTSYDQPSPPRLRIGVGAMIAGLDQTLIGQPVGSRLLVVVPPDKGYGAEGNPQWGIGGTDTLVYVIDILDAQ